MIDKPAGPTSHDVVARVRRVLRQRGVGHAGTLDPFATGLLVVLVGRATRLARFVEQQRKTYLAEAVLGVATDTDDATGTPLEGTAAAKVMPSAAEVGEALAALVGTHPQRPPAYSARRVAGERAYRLARRGAAVELPATPVTVHALDLLEWAPPVARFRTTVSAGTYIRAMARDLGDRLGMGAHLRALRREAIGNLRVEDAVSLEALDAATPLWPPLAMVPQLTQVALDADGVRRSAHGQVIPADGAEGQAALVADGRLIAVAEGDAMGWHPRVVLEAA